MIYECPCLLVCLSVCPFGYVFVYSSIYKANTYRGAMIHFHHQKSYSQRFLCLLRIRFALMEVHGTHLASVTTGKTFWFPDG